MFADEFFSTGHADARLLRQLGITRVGDIAGLDCIDIPVWFACRPNSRALSVSQGKGATDAQARIAAVMEAAEGAVAERPEDLVDSFGTVAETAAQGRKVVPFEQLMRCRPELLRTDHRYAWVRGEALRAGCEVLAPFELIGLDMRAATPWDHAAFKMSSIGLAAGRDRAAVIVHALQEVIEHDATSALDLLGLGAGIARPVEYVPGRHAGLDRLVALVRTAGFEPKFFSLGRRFHLPVIGCFFARLVASADGAGATLTAGFACRPDAHDAAVAALLECVQSRATDIAGSRDDIKDSDYGGSRARLPSDAGPALQGFDAVPGHRPQDGAENGEMRLDHLMACLGTGGIEDIYCFPLAKPELGIEVVRVLVPDLAVGGEGGVTAGGAGLIDALLGIGA